MPPAVIAEIGLAVGIVAAIALDAVLNTVAALGFVGDDGAEQQAADNPGRNRAAVTAVMATATSVSRAAAVPVLRLNKQRAVAGLRLRRQNLRDGAGQWRAGRGSHQQENADHCARHRK